MGIDKSYENVTVDIEDNYYFSGADAVQTSQTRSSYDYELPLVFEPLVKKLRSRTLNFLDFYPFRALYRLKSHSAKCREDLEKR